MPGEKSTPYVVVIGAVNIDIGGRSHAPLLRRDSNPGTVTTSLGGVGRNIAHNLRLLRVPVNFITALGGDAHAQRIREHCVALGIDLSAAVTVPELSTSTYLFITGPDGDMELAIADTDISKSITPEFLESRRETINGAKAVVFDSNLTPESIEWLGRHITAPLFTDPVSVAKAPKLIPVLNRLHTIKPNLIEAERLTGESGPEAAVKALLSLGVKRAFVSLGANGMYAAEAAGAVQLPCFPGKLINATGGGDAGMAALVWAQLRGLSLEQSARAALAAGAVAIECAATINDKLSPEELISRAGL